MEALQQCRDELNLDVFLLYPLRHKMSVRAVLSVSKTDRDCRWPCGRFSVGKVLNRAQQDKLRLLLVARGGGGGEYKWALTGIDTDSRLLEIL